MREFLARINTKLHAAVNEESRERVIILVNDVRAEIVEKRNAAQLYDTILARVGELQMEKRAAEQRAAALEKENDQLKMDLARAVSAASMIPDGMGVEA